MKKLLTLFTLSSLVVLAGCASDPASVNANVGNTEVLNQNENAEVVVANTNGTENTNEVVNENTNAVGTALELSENTTDTKIDTSDWLTYTNEEYGFSFRYPKTLYISDKTSIQAGERYKLLLTLGKSQDPSDEDIGVDVWQTNLTDRYNGVVNSIKSDPNQEVISEESSNSISKTITTRNRISGETKIKTLTESNANVISFTCAEWSDKEICSQIVSTLQLL